MLRDRRTPRQHVVALVLALAVILTLFVLLHPRNASLANGILSGGLAVLAFGVFALVRRGRGRGSSSLERGLGSAADERDEALMTRTLAVDGIAGMALMSANLVAVALGVRPEVAGTLATWADLGVMGAAYAWHARRM